MNSPEASLDIIDADANKNDIRWEDEGTEFYLHGEMYDVAFIKTINGKTLIYCLNDKKEDQLLEDYSKMVSAGNDQATGGKDDHYTIKFQIHDYLLFSSEMIIAVRNVRQKHSGYSVRLISVAPEIITPPPDLTL